MTDPAQFSANRPVYYEPAGSYLSSIVMTVLVVGGFIVDCVRAGKVVHVLGWGLAGVAIIGVNALVTHAARTLRSITVTVDRLSVGEQFVERVHIASIEPDARAAPRVLGQTMHTSLPRGIAGLGLRLVDNTVVAVPTRHPDRLAAALDVAEPQPEVRLMEPDDKSVMAEVGNRTAALFKVAGIELPPEWAGVALRDDSVVVFVVGRPAEGFIRLTELDGQAHIAVLAVVPGVMRRGVGSQLLEAACAWAATHTYTSITVSTYAEVPWNAPFFRSRGFVDIEQYGPAMTALRAWERDIGLDGPGPRVVMKRDLGD